MNTERIEAAMRTATDTADVVIGAGGLSSVDEMFSRNFGDQPVVVVADENTFKVAGNPGQQQFEAAGRRTDDPYMFAGRPTMHGEYPHIEKLGESLRTHDAVPVAVGSGTLNDIVKRASYECKRRYM